jgi:plastocyanin
MSKTASHRSTRIGLAAAIGFAVIVNAGYVWESFATGHEAVTQQERIFHPNRLDIARGDIVGVLNDDGELLHHAYVATDEFSFDSGEQEPGSTTDIRFTKAGTFTVRCRIHPKMSLIVTVK